MSSGNGISSEVSDLGETKSLLDQILAGRSAEFKAKVYELVVRFQWDVNDPSFAILVATGQMELLLAEFPDQFEALFASLLLRLQTQSEGLQNWFTGEKGDLKELIRGLEAQQSQESEEVKDRIKKFSAHIQAQQKWTETSMASVLTVAQQEREALFKEVKEKLYRERINLQVQVQSDTRSWLNTASESWRLASIKDLAMGSGIAGGVVLAIGMLFGIGIYRGMIEPAIGVPEAMQLLKWNQVELRECVKVKRTTCNFHIVDPETPPKPQK